MSKWYMIINTFTAGTVRISLSFQRALATAQFARRMC